MKYSPIILCWYIFVMVGVVAGQKSDKSLPKLAAVSPQPCEEPLTWNIGRIDSRFDINRATVKKIMEKIGGWWSQAAGKKVITYSDSARVELNLIYGREQRVTDNEQQLSQRIDGMKFEHLILEQDYEQLYNAHNTARATYEQTLNEYRKKVKTYNNLAARRSDTGVIPRLEKEQMIKLKKQIKMLRRQLTADEGGLNRNVKKLQTLSERLDRVADQVNRLIYTYKDTYASNRTFYQGVYIDDLNHKKINIYEFENRAMLTLVLAHEAGHALGISHLDNPRSIMHYKMEKQDEHNLQLSDEDVRAIRERCSTSES